MNQQTDKAADGGSDSSTCSVSSRVELDPEEWNEDGEFCIMDPARPDWSLCGLHLPDDADIDDDEVPDEITCEDCLAIQRAAKSPQNVNVEARGK